MKVRNSQWIWKKLKYFLISICGLAMLSILIWIFSVFYISLGERLMESDEEKTVTLFRILSKIDYQGVGIMFAISFIFMLLIDIIVVLIIHAFQKLNEKDNQIEKKKLSFNIVLFEYKNIHVLFILLTIFTTVAITAPSLIINSFTAIVSISILVLNIAKKLEK